MRGDIERETIVVAEAWDMEGGAYIPRGLVAYLRSGRGGKAEGWEDVV